jgi:predicted AAA+ superfamily ATPase
MLERQLQPTLQRFANAFPVVAITGSRQSGKTTFARHFFSRFKYVSFEDPSELAFAHEDPRGFLARFAKGAAAEGFLVLSPGDAR